MICCANIAAFSFSVSQPQLTCKQHKEICRLMEKHLKAKIISHSSFSVGLKGAMWTKKLPPNTTLEWTPLCTNDVLSSDDFNILKLFTAFREGGCWSVQSHHECGLWKMSRSSVLKNQPILALTLGHFVLIFFFFLSEASSNKIAVTVPKCFEVMPEIHYFF